MGSGGDWLAVGVPVTKSAGPHAPVQASTRTRLALGGKFTRIGSLARTSTESKNAASVSSTTNCLSQSVPVFWATNFTWTFCPGSPG